jgi:hypothetical protein
MYEVIYDLLYCYQIKLRALATKNKIKNLAPLWQKIKK